MAKRLKLPGLLLVAALLLEVSAELSIELGRIMQKHWTEQQLFQSSNDLASMDSSMKRSSSLGSMKRVASGNSINRVHSTSELNKQSSSTPAATTAAAGINDNTFMQRLLRGVTTILRSRLLMAIFTYNALYASTTVLLSFQRAALVANRDANTTAEADTAFLANINMASSVAVFALQATGAGAYVAHRCGQRGTLSLMPLIRLLGVFALAWWHHTSNGQPPNLLIFLVVDECCKIMNMAVAKPVRESLWRGLSNEARYEAKPIVDTLANRWGGGSAAFLVSFLDKTLNLFGVMPGSDGVRYLFGFPPVLLLCMVIATWWAAVSADLGVIRTKIDQELKKMV
jgi:ATP/ADP translocase